MIEMRSLPFQSAIYPDESFMGYCLRMSNANGLQGLYWLYRMLNRDRLNHLLHEDISSVATLFGADYHDLEARFVQLNRSEGEGICTTIGHVIRKPYLLRHLRPQVCPVCLKDNGYARFIWDFSLVSVCEKHGSQLLDLCSFCQRKIQWSRPYLTHCTCGRPWIDSLSEPIPANHASLDLATLVANQIPGSNGLKQTPQGSEIMAIFKGLSLDTLFRILWAFGVKASASEGVAAGVSRTILRTQQAHQLVERAIQRLSICIKSQTDIPDSLIQSVHLPALHGLAKEALEPADAQFIGSLRLKLNPSCRGQKNRGQMTTKQLLLF